jgi:hypothetical protein
MMHADYLARLLSVNNAHSKNGACTCDRRPPRQYPFGSPAKASSPQQHIFKAYISLKSLLSQDQVKPLRALDNTQRHARLSLPSLSLSMSLSLSRLSRVQEPCTGATHSTTASSAPSPSKALEWFTRPLHELAIIRYILEWLKALRKQGGQSLENRAHIMQSFHHACHESSTPGLIITLHCCIFHYAIHIIGAAANKNMHALCNFLKLPVHTGPDYDLALLYFHYAIHIIGAAANKNMHALCNFLKLPVHTGPDYDLALLYFHYAIHIIGAAANKNMHDLCNFLKLSVHTGPDYDLALLYSFTMQFILLARAAKKSMHALCNCLKLPVMLRRVWKRI